MSVRYTSIVSILIINQFVHAEGSLQNKDESHILLGWSGNFSEEAPLIPEHCRKTTVCATVGNYPIDLVNGLMKRLRSKKYTKFNIDVLHVQETGDVTDLCPATEPRILYPRAAVDQNGDWQFILNQKNDFQGYRVHRCLHSSEVRCSKTLQISKYQFGFECEQKFTKRKMVYLDMEKKAARIDYFKVPLCCSCNLLKLF